MRGFHCQLSAIIHPKAPARAHPVLTLLVDDTLSADALARRSGLAVADLALTLTELEMAGALERVTGGYRRCGG